MPRSKASKTARRRPRQARSRETVETLLEAAAQVFEREGRGATTDRVAERAGVSVGSLYQYFANKEALITALGERHLDEAEAHFVAALQQASFDGPIETLIAQLLDALVAMHAERPRLHEVLSEELPRSPAIRARLDAMEQRFATLIAAGLRAHPEVELADPTTTAQLLVVWADALAHRLVIRPPEGGDADAIRREAERFVLAGLRAPAATRR